MLAITALGQLTPGEAIGRGDGRPGDRLVSTGPHGLSRLGLALLLGETPKESLEGEGFNGPSGPIAAPSPASMPWKPWSAADRPRSPGGSAAPTAAMAWPRP